MNGLYARPTRLEDGRISIPENYDGVAFMEKPEADALPERSIKVLGSPSSEAKISPQGALAQDDTAERREHGSITSEDAKAEEVSASVASGLFPLIDKLPFAGFLGRLIPDKERKISIPKIGAEEILIIATATFLFFSKEGDKECAIMLFLLLLVVK